MKRIKLLALFTVLSICLIVLLNFRLNAKVSSHTLIDKNLKVLRSDDTHLRQVSNGPAKLYSCPGFFSGKGKYCMSENKYPCVDIPCKMM